MEKWSGRVALVTGASSGIGSSIARDLVKAGMKVVGCARRVDNIKSLANDLKNEKGSLIAVKCDLTKDEDINALFKTIKDTFGGVDVCINNAGLSHHNDLLHGTPTEWRHMMDVNVIAVCLCTKLTVESMRERGVDDGHIINIGSVCGHQVASLAFLHFLSATKFAIRAITEGLRQELREAKSHIRATVISPAGVYTEALQHGMGDDTASKLLAAKLILNADDISATTMHVLASPPHVEINDVIMRARDSKDI